MSFARHGTASGTAQPSRRATPKGEARFRLTPQDQFLSFVLLGYTKQELRISELSGDSFTVRLQPSTTPIREAAYQGTPHHRAGDTLRYRVKAFAGKRDRYLEDVLKKLPGVEVKENGRIEYQGTPINKFYIEGQDPLGSNYTQASRNIPINAVDQVEVIEHNQHKRVLQGLVSSDQAALNIRLSKASRSVPSGRSQRGRACLRRSGREKPSSCEPPRRTSSSPHSRGIIRG